MITYENLLGRPYVDGVTDCYGVIRDFYQQNFNIELTNYARPEGWLYDPKLDLFGQHFFNEGFRIVDIQLRDLEIGDGLLFSIRSNKYNHCAIYVGEGKVLHHMPERFSTAELLTSWMRNTLMATIRHKDVRALLPKPKPHDLMEDINEFWKNEFIRTGAIPADDSVEAGEGTGGVHST